MAIFVLNAEERPPDACRGGAVSVGNFDGVHRGHAVLVRALVAQARQVGGPAVAVLFDPHPIALLAPERLRPLLTTPRDRAERLHAAGVTHVVILRTTPELLRLEARAFLDGTLGDQLGARALAEGFNFRFGRGRTGDNDLLAEWCRERGLPLTVVPSVSFDGGVVSSSRVREVLEAGNVWCATRLLGRWYRLRGVVGVGAKRGKTLGFPTANLEQIETLLPADGVYAVRAHLENGAVWPGAANVGPNPTFGEQARKVEVHLIGFSGDLYGRPLAVEFVTRLRNTRPFKSPAQLAGQLRADAQLAQRMLNLVAPGAMTVGAPGAKLPAVPVKPPAWRGYTFRNDE